jgi:UTP--glucose-1-phosphate uridylyltransferase
MAVTATDTVFGVSLGAGAVGRRPNRLTPTADEAGGTTDRPMDVNKAVIPAAGLGTRFLPVTKAQPKEMMPVLDKPTIQYVVEEAIDAGIDDVLIITGRGKQTIERHFDRSYELEAELAAAGKEDRLERVRDITDLVDIHYVRQKDRDGLGDAVTYARKHVGEEPFALLLGDTIVESEVSCTARLIEFAEEHGTSVVSLERVPWERVSAYGVADLDDSDPDADCFPVRDFVEKPPRDEAPSNLAITGRYVLTHEVFDALDRIDPGVGDELQLTDAIRELDGVRGVELRGDRYDIGNIPDWLRANVRMALDHDEGDLNEAVAELITEERDG